MHVSYTSSASDVQRQFSLKVSHANHFFQLRPAEADETNARSGMLFPTVA